MVCEQAAGKCDIIIFTPFYAPPPTSMSCVWFSLHLSSPLNPQHIANNNNNQPFMCDCANVWWWRDASSEDFETFFICDMKYGLVYSALTVNEEWLVVLETILFAKEWNDDNDESLSCWEEVPFFFRLFNQLSIKHRNDLGMETGNEFCLLALNEGTQEYRSGWI